MDGRRKQLSCLNDWGGLRKELVVVMLGFCSRAREVADTTVDEGSLVLVQQGWADLSKCALQQRIREARFETSCLCALIF